MTLSQKYSLYELVNPIDNSVFYIGITNRTLQERLSEHCKPTQYKKSPKKRLIIHSIKEKGLKPIINCLFDNLSKEEVLDLEYQMIWKMNIAGYNLANVSEGGNHYHIPTLEERKRISKKLTGLIHSEQTRKKMSLKSTGSNNAMFGKIHTEETKQKMSLKSKGNKRWLGKNHNEISKQKISQANKGRKRLNPFTKKIIVIDLQTNEKKNFNSVKDAAQYYQTGLDNISIVLNGRGKTFLNKKYTAIYEVPNDME